MRPEKNLGTAIGLAIDKDFEGMKNLLYKNGVKTDIITTKKDLADVYADAMNKSRTLVEDFMEYAEKKTTTDLSGQHLNTGGNIFGDPILTSSLLDKTPPITTYGNNDLMGYNPSDFGFNFDKQFQKDLGGTTAGANAAANSGSGFFAGLNLKDILNNATAIYLADKTKPVSPTTTGVITSSANDAVNKGYNPQAEDSGSKTTFIVIGLLGVGLLGTAIYVMSKKK